MKTPESRRANNPRKHHYVPKFYLAGFTPSGQDEDLLWVYDLKLKKSRRDKPVNVAWLRDYHRLELEGRDPTYFEKLFGDQIEGPAANILRNLVTSVALPKGEDFEILMNFIALMVVRVPSVRAALARSHEELFNQVLQLHAQLPTEQLDALIERMRKEDPDLPDNVSGESLKDFIKSGEFSNEFSQDWHMRSLVMGYLANLDFLFSLLMQRNWFLFVAKDGDGDFVCSDKPVNRYWTVPVPAIFRSSPGFGIGTRVLMPINRRITLVGDFEHSVQQTITVDKEIIATCNNLTVSQCTRYIYSPSDPFQWRQPDGTIGNSADLFSMVRDGKS